MMRRVPARQRFARLFMLLMAALSACGDDDTQHVAKPRDTDAGDASPAPTDSGSPAPPIQLDAGGKLPTQPQAGKPAPQPDANTPQPDAAVPVVCVDAVCAALSGACTLARCNHVTETCDMMMRSDGTACGDPSDDRCTDPDTCLAGQCVPNHQAQGSVCGHQAEACRNADTCDGAGRCVEHGLATVGAPCGDANATDCDAADSCDAFGQCQANHTAAGADCNDHDVACRINDVCDGNGACLDNGVLAQGTSCNTRGLSITACHPGADLCDAQGNCLLGDAPDGSACNDPTNTECDDPDSCFRGVCVPNNAPANAPCGDQGESQCDHPDQCNGAGACLNHRENIGVPCGVQSDACVLQSACDVNGQCASGGPAAASTPCGSPIQNSCTAPDTCNGSGTCLPNHAAVNTVCTAESRDCRDADLCDGSGTCQVGAVFPQGTACGSTSTAACDQPDSCDLGGNCSPNYAANGAACGDQGVPCQNNDACDTTGHCIDKGPMIPCSSTISGTVFGLDTQLGLAGVTVEDRGTHLSAQTDSSGHFTLAVPYGVSVELEYHAVSGYWGQLRFETFSVSHTNADMTLITDARVAADAAEVTGLAALNANLGIVNARFSGYSGTGGEAVTLGASSAPPFTLDASSHWVASPSLLIDGLAQLFFINTALGTTTAAASGNGSNSCTAIPASNLHVVAHTFTELFVSCQ